MSQLKEVSSRTGIREFYAGKNVMVTGATGFMGKVLVEKLLRSIPEIGNVYILVREKRGKTSKERLDNLLSSRVSCDLIGVRVWLAPKHYHNKSCKRRQLYCVMYCIIYCRMKVMLTVMTSYYILH